MRVRSAFQIAFGILLATGLGLSLAGQPELALDSLQSDLLGQLEAYSGHEVRCATSAEECFQVVRSLFDFNWSECRLAPGTIIRIVPAATQTACPKCADIRSDADWPEITRILKQQSQALDALRTEATDVLDPSTPFRCSTDPKVGCSGLFGSHDDARIALLSNGEPSFVARVQSVLNAKKSIHIQSLSWNNDESGRYLAKLLEKRKRDGLDIRVIEDAISNRQMNRAWLFYDMLQNGLDVIGWSNVYLDKNPIQLNKRFHEKMWIVDGEDPAAAEAIIGGMNVGNEYFRVDRTPGKYWRDEDLLLRGSIVQDIEAAFERNWKYMGELASKNDDVDPNPEDSLESVSWFKTHFFRLPFFHGDDRRIENRVEDLSSGASRASFELEPARARFFQNRPRLHERFLAQVYLDLIDSARSEILIENAYFVPDKALIEALRNAVRRGVDVTILTNSLETHDFSALAYVSRYTYFPLHHVNEEPQVKERSHGNLRIFEWNGGGTMHSKFAVFDRRISLVGSYNLDPRSELLNSENATVFESGTLANELVEQMLEDDLAMSREVSREEILKYHEPSDPGQELKLWFLVHVLKGLL